MTEILMRLGAYTWMTPFSAYQTMRRKHEYRWQAQPRIGRRPAQQYVGPGEETIDWPGIFYSDFGPINQIEALRAEANQGQPLLLIDGRGNLWGHYVIRRIEETQSFFFPDGTPRKIEFRIEIAHYGNDP